MQEADCRSDGCLSGSFQLRDHQVTRGGLPWNRLSSTVTWKAIGIARSCERSDGVKIPRTARIFRTPSFARSYGVAFNLSNPLEAFWRLNKTEPLEIDALKSAGITISERCCEKSSLMKKGLRLYGLYSGDQIGWREKSSLMKKRFS